MEEEIFVIFIPHKLRAVINERSLNMSEPLYLKIRFLGITITLVEQNIRAILHFSFPRVSEARLDVIIAALKELAALNRELVG
jgi:hypothetical protein